MLEILLEKLEFSKRSTEKKYNSLSPGADFNSLMIQQEFAKTQPSIEEETDDRVSLRELDQGDDRARKVHIWLHLINLFNGIKKIDFLTWCRKLC